MLCTTYAPNNNWQLKYMKEERKLLVITITPSQEMELNRVWKAKDGCMNRSDFVREAINAYSGVKIFEVK